MENVCSSVSQGARSPPRLRTLYELAKELLPMRKLGLHVKRGLLVALVAASVAVPQAMAQDEGPSVTLMKFIGNAQKSMSAGRMQDARDNFRKAIGLSPNTVELYLGLFNCCYQTKEFDQVAFALQKVFELEPSMKDEFAGDYGEALYYLGRYDEAIPLLKQGLKYLDSPQAKAKPRTAMVKIPDNLPVIETPPPPPPTQVAVATPAQPLPHREAHDPASPEGWDKLKSTPEEVEVHKLSQTLHGAIRCEGILIAEYQGFEKSDDITYFRPPKAKFRIQRILKGPPLNKDLPVRYEFHDRSKDINVPKDWKFGEDKMPEKASKWILFIEWCHPRGGMFDLYQGCYGRLPATDENLNKVYALLEEHSNR